MKIIYTISKNVITAIAIICVAILTGIALIKGIDGAIFMSAIFFIGGMAGYEVRKKIAT